MSVLFERAVARFAPEDASLVAADGDELEPTDEAVPVQPIGEFATRHERLAHPEEGWTCIPLHGPTDAAPTDEFVGYTDHPVRCEIVLVRQAGEYEAVPVEAFGDTRLARRLRFWHSDYLPETYPPATTPRSTTTGRSSRSPSVTTRRRFSTSWPPTRADSTGTATT